MKTLILSLLIALSCFSPSHEASSAMRCFTEPKSVKVALEKSTAVFAGEVLEIWTAVNFRQARFRVERSWKGVAADEVFVVADETAESPHYKVGEKYLVFAGIRNDKLFTGICSRTKRLEYAAGDLQQLGKGKLHRKAE